MPAQIDWKTEDENEWGDFVPDGEPSPGGWRPSRRARHILLALALTIVIAAMAIWQISRFLESNTDEVEQEVLDGHALAMETAESGDGDLLRELILDRLEDWTDAQVQLANEGLFLDRYPMDLHLLKEGMLPASTSVELDPGLRRALIKMTVPYRVGRDTSGADTVKLQQEFLYRYEDERWLLDPPIGAYWGPTKTISGRYLTLAFPERDAELGQRLAADLEAALGQACHEIIMMNCQSDLHLVVTLVTDPAVLIEIADPAWQFGDGFDVKLPTPTLLGRPSDEAAYRALNRAYAQRVVARLIAEQTDLATSNQPLIGLAFSDMILGQLGLRASDEFPDRIRLAGGDIVSSVDRVWNNSQPLEDQLTDEEVELARALVDFVSTVWSDLPETEMLRLMGQSGTGREWLRYLNPAASDTDLAVAWNSYWTGGEQATTVLSWPDEVVLLMCDHGIVGSSNVYQYDPEQEILSRVLSGREFIRMEPLPGGEGVLLTEQLIRQAGQRTYLWRDGRLEPYEQNDQLGIGALSTSTRPWRALASPARQNEATAVSSDGRWLAELGDGTLILSAPDAGIRKIVPHGGNDCRGVAWVQSASEGVEP